MPCATRVVMPYARIGMPHTGSIGLGRSPPRLPSRVERPAHRIMARMYANDTVTRCAWGRWTVPSSRRRRRCCASPARSIVRTSSPTRNCSARDRPRPRAREAGQPRLRALDQPGNYLAPGIDERNTEAIAWLEKRGWRRDGEPRTNVAIAVRANPRVTPARAEDAAEAV